ncbi:fatty acid desaturase [Aliamphritea hakodatensis]|uniref:fatty acid desaturase n=1 Tax=Aliamphritea hakodatensis TaxID=2895352 RepID=UPI0022FD7DF0|nr:fatty acid desaturase [Aliamphritea hakodatensis]
MPAKCRFRIEWPTLLLIIACYGSWWLAMSAVQWSALVWLSLPVVLALQSSLQHEVLHNHPTGWRWLNELLVFLPIGIFLPYERFRDSHLIHHQDENLTDPYDDPESHYVDPQRWQAMPTAVRDIYNFNNSLLGRMLIGPALSMWLFYRSDLRAVMSGDWPVIRAYLMHLLGLLPVLWWLAEVAQVSLWIYLLCAYGGLSILKIRTFLEHRAHFAVAARTVVVEDRGALAFLFLNNNFHAVHHQCPGVAWYRLPALYREQREQFLADNQQYRYDNYRQVFKEYFLQAKEPVSHPQMPVTQDTPVQQNSGEVVG